MDRPILMSAPMIRALLAGTKTQTRRVVKPGHAGIPGQIDGYVYNGHALVKTAGTAMSVYPLRCPYWKNAGDRLWVREAWMADPPITSDWPSTVFNGCKPRDHSLIPECYRKPEHCLYRADGHDNLHGWTPGIHMFRWASRITLEVTGVRVERLQAISVEDCRAEGGQYHSPIDVRAWYRDLWNQINGPQSWESNPWVWVMGFRRLAKLKL